MTLRKWSLIAATWALAAALSTGGVLTSAPASAAHKEIAGTQVTTGTAVHHPESPLVCCRPPWCLAC